MKIKIWHNQDNIGNSKNTLKGVNKSQRDSRSSRTSKNAEPCVNNNVSKILNELNSLIGLKNVKKLINEIYAFVEIQKRRQKENLVTEPLVLHMIFKGNPGTGKTTVARIIGKLFKELGVLTKGHLVEVERADLVGEYIGHTAQSTREQIKKAMGGILFIDEAYSLARGGEKDFGKEAIDTIVKSMEDYKDNLILILAGYQDEMEWFIETNPGLRSRFPIIINFPDYSISELLAIGDLMLKQRQYKLSSGSREELRVVLEKKVKDHKHSGNARLVRNIIEQAIRHQAVRLIKFKEKGISREDLMSIKREDINFN
ncbi:AAA family ATPase [Desulfolucanica intricata]|uniref:AAA family ATPase n=1 Tax=Desulfolucanica intricata TaxID=1285191 RepID=UPI00083605DA|nr:AAA family ATPase [Desulfolucanica intricata]